MRIKGPAAGPFPFILQSISIEQFLEKGLLPFGMTMLMAVSIRLSVTSIVALIILRL
jgi:hypothetical protein